MKWHHYGRKKLQTCPVVIKTYYVFVDAAGKEEKKFKKFVYKFSEDINQTVVIHYQGDDSIAINSALHVRTLPSIMRQLESAETTPSVAYKRMVATTGPSQEHLAVQLPRNRKQIKNLQSRWVCGCQPIILLIFI